MKQYFTEDENGLKQPEHQRYNTFRNIAEESFEYISDGIQNVQELSGIISNNLTCNRSFTTKLERAGETSATVPWKSCSRTRLKTLRLSQAV